MTSAPELSTKITACGINVQELVKSKLITLAQKKKKDTHYTCQCTGATDKRKKKLMYQKQTFFHDLRPHFETNLPRSSITQGRGTRF